MCSRSPHVHFASTTAKLLVQLVLLAAFVHAGKKKEGSLHHLLENLGVAAPLFDSGYDGSGIPTCSLLCRSCDTSGEEGFKPGIKTANVILPNRSRKDFTEDSSPAGVLVAFGGGLLATLALLCPCLRPQKKSESKDFPSKETSKPIIHRDVKSSNILLTEKFRAKVADFGYSRMGPIEIGETHVSTEIKGTTGYLDPEYLKTFQLTQKSDVYSFGIVLIEIITGRRPIDEKKDMKERVALRWAFKKFLNGNMMEILDRRLESSTAACRVAEKICALAFQCTAPTKQDRPTMKEVAEALWSIRKEFQESQEGKMNTREPEKHAGKQVQEIIMPGSDATGMEKAKSSK